MKLTKHLIFWGQLLSLVILVLGFYVFLSEKDFSRPVPQVKKATAQSGETVASDEKTEAVSKELTRPTVTLDDWELLLVNTSHQIGELSPELGVVGPVYVDNRIVDATMAFLMAAQAIDPNVHLITGYRSLADQEALYNGYVDQEMQVNGLTYEAALQAVQAYIQAPGTSEHQTGLGIDLGTVDQVNQMDPLVAKKIQLLAPDHGFVLRYPKGKESMTGQPYEDWHYRYVGVESAKYMTQQGLTLEEYIEEIRRGD